ncbi:MAG: hypothetical protein ACI8P3_000242 [Saprospiraceae bacterium]|jgi:hypothetical protein
MNDLAYRNYLTSNTSDEFNRTVSKVPKLEHTESILERIIFITIGELNVK